MKITKETLNKVVKQTIEELRNIPTGGGEALTCEEAGKAAGDAYAKENKEFAAKIHRTAKGRQISGEHSGALDIAAKEAMAAQGFRACTEGPDGMKAMDAFREGFLAVANENPQLGHFDASGPKTRAQLPRTGRGGPGPQGDIRESRFKISRETLNNIIKEEILAILEGYGPDEFATAAGMQQDIDARDERGSFEQGDFGIEGEGWGEMKNRGDFPWIQDALSSLSDESHPARLKAVEALANELGVSVSFRPFEPLEEGEKDYPNNSTMKKLVSQAKRSKKDVGRNPNYDPKDDAQLKKDYDKHVRDTRRDPKHNRKGK